MNIPLLDLKAQYQQIKPEVQKAINEVIDSQHFILGPAVEKFEAEIARFIGIKYAVGVASCSDSLLLSLMALGINPAHTDTKGMEVITTPFTFFATAGAIARLGVTPVFADIEPDTFNISPDAIAAALKKHKNVKAIIPVHLYGQSADLEPIMELGRKYNIPIIEDAAQSIGATYKGQNTGTFGLLGCLSFFPSKNLGAWGDAGLIVTNDEKMYQMIRSLRLHGGQKKYYHQYVGCNSRLDAVQAAVLSVKLKYITEWTAKRQERAQYYNQLFKKYNLSGFVTPPPIRPDCNHIYHQYTIRAKNRDGLKDFLKQQNIGTEVYYPLALHLQDCFRYLGYKKGDLPESEKATQEALSLPIYPELRPAQQEYVVEQIAGFYR
ncbi:MAG: DegT/DnrJ/EryC1/StrS family aminotransferase [Planctomycetes bacterium]|nr:DegT/DnrJ/EryC1/StrS family aminotransferase [Planctomycetota bacterium]